MFIYVHICSLKQPSGQKTSPDNMLITPERWYDTSN